MHNTAGAEYGRSAVLVYVLGSQIPQQGYVCKGRAKVSMTPLDIRGEPKKGPSNHCLAGPDRQAQRPVIREKSSQAARKHGPRNISSASRKSSTRPRFG